MQVFTKDQDVGWEILKPNQVKRKIKAHSDKIMMVEVCFENGAVGDLHKHFHEQATYCLEGTFEFTVGDEKTVVKAGDTIYMPPDSLHGCKVLSDKGRVLDVFTPCREDFLKK